MQVGCVRIQLGLLADLNSSFGQERFDFEAMVRAACFDQDFDIHAANRDFPTRALVLDIQNIALGLAN